MKVEGFAKVNGTNLHYDEQGSGHALVMVHGFSLDTRMWDSQIAAFAPHFKVIRYDIRGHGKSTPPSTEGFYHADDLKGLLDYLGVTKAHIMGLSLGGAIATEFVLAYPNRATALIAVDPVLWNHPLSPEHAASLGKIWDVGAALGVEAAKALWLAHPMFAPALQRPLVAAPLTEIITDYSGWHWTHHDPGLLPDPPASEHLGEIAVPTLAVIGELDIPDFHTITDILAERIPGARKVVLPYAGHMSNMEEPDSFNKIVLNFLAQVDA
jgi:3-oxoadipate enol-lactonase